MPRRATARPTRHLRILAWVLGSLAALATIALIAGQMWLDRYLRSAEFREMLEGKTGQNIRADVEVAPIRIEGTQFYCDSFTARGSQEAAFSIAKVEELRGEVSLPSVLGLVFGERKFRVPSIEIQRLSLEFFDRDRINLFLPPKEPKQDRSVIENLDIREVRLAWGGGGLAGTSVRANPIENGWQFEGNGGRITQLGIPPVDLVSARIVRKEGSIFIQDARLRQNDGDLSLSGEIVSKEKADLVLNVANVNVTPYLPDDWRARLHGRLRGEIRLKIPMKDPANATPEISGRLSLDGAVLEALPVLTKIADYLRTDKFRRVEFSQASADVRYDASALRVTNLVLESKQLIAIKGAFTVQNGIVDGLFDVGITPAPLQWLPGSTTKVFTEQRDGYVWTKMRLTGPPDALKEDLSSRLVDAAGQAVVEKVESTATEAVDKAVDSAKRGAEGVLNLLFGN
jgi:hypothetical protein